MLPKPGKLCGAGGAGLFQLDPLRRIGAASLLITDFAACSGYCIHLPVHSCKKPLHILRRVQMELYKMLPYLVTIIVLVAVSMRKKRENEPPAALGLAYFREERSFQSSTVFAVELCYYALLAATGRVFMPQGGKKHVV